MDFIDVDDHDTVATLIITMLTIMYFIYDGYEDVGSRVR